MYWESQWVTGPSTPPIPSRSPPEIPINSQYSSQNQLPSPPPSLRDDSSGLSEDEELGYNDVVRQGKDKNVQQLDAESIISPVISRTQSRALYRNALSPIKTPEIFLEDDVEDVPVHRNMDGALQPPKRSSIYGNTSNYSEISSRREPLENETEYNPRQGKKSKTFGFLPNVSFGGGKSSRARSKTLSNPRSGSAFTKRASSFFSSPPETYGTPAEELDAFFNRPSEPTGNRPENLEEARHPHPPTHRRSTSTPSIRPKSATPPPIDPPDPINALSRTLSSASSLGDDAKFLNIHTYGNARIKAIFDSLPTFEFPQLAQFNPFSDTDSVHATPSISSANSSRSPYLDALDTVVGDIVVMGGYRGSILRDRANGDRRVWVPLKVGLNLRKVDLEVGLTHEDEERMHEKIYASGMLANIGPVDVSKKLLKRMKSGAKHHGRRVHDWGYDWRLSPELLSRRLIEFLETLPCNINQPEGKARGKGALVIAHSFGGLVTRHAMNRRPELFSGVIFAGTPQTCVSILGPFRNGDPVMLNSKVFTAQVNFTLRTSYAFLPDDGMGFVDRATGNPIPLDFFNVDTWKEYCLSPCVSTFEPLPALSTTSEMGPVPPPKDRILAPQTSSASSSISDIHLPPSAPVPLHTQCTLPLTSTIPYLKRVLAETLRFRKGMEHRPEKEELYPPMTVLYSKTSPTVRGILVNGAEGIKRVDAYEDLLFGAGDGVVLAKKAMLPKGYRCTRRVAVDRGHISLLGDLEGVGKCVLGIIEERGW